MFSFVSRAGTLQALFVFLLACLSVFFFASPTMALTATGNFTSQIIITANCSVGSTNALNFNTQGVLSANVDATATFAVTCTNSTTYNVGLDAGTTTGGTTSTRLMVNGANTISYKMYSDSSHATNWGNTVGTDTVAGTGTGVAQALTIYGRVPVQTTPAPATYTDLVTITVTY